MRSGNGAEVPLVDLWLVICLIESFAERVVLVKSPLLLVACLFNSLFDLQFVY